MLTPSYQGATARDVTEAIVALHATDPASVYLSAAVRMREPSIQAIEGALYEDRSLVRMLGMRRTVFVVPRDVAPIVQAACTLAIAQQQRKLTHALLSGAHIAEDVLTWTSQVEAATLAALRARGEASAQELGRDVPELKLQVRVAEGKSYSAMQGIATRILLVLSADGHIVRGRPRGSWLSTQYRWQPTERWLGQPFADMDTATAQTELVRRWLSAFGPGTLDDLRWWTGLSLGAVRRALAALPVADVHLDDREGVMLAADVELEHVPEPSLALLPALDPAPMGYIDRTWFLGPHERTLFDRTGNIGPTVWWDGRIVGGWAQRAAGEVVFRLLEDVGREAELATADRVARLQEWLGPRRVTPRFRSPLERELST
ncbi:MAG: winged helix DNA-binding domain-containing protein [Chloroflexota bacterium]